MSIELIQGDCLEKMKVIPGNSVDLILTDPPYFMVKKEEWDNQWKTREDFLSWIDSLAEQWQRILKPNGSLYCFASPRMSARIEILLEGRFNVLCRITWDKENNKCGALHRRCRKEDLRSFFAASENIVFAEQYGADSSARGEAGYQIKCDELRGFVFEPLREYFVHEKKRCGITSKEIREGMKKLTGKRYVFERHTFSTSQWNFPTKEQYEAARELFNAKGGDFLRKDYEELRKDYEELRRPFRVTKDVPYTDVWTYEVVRHYKGKHICEKPLRMLQDIIRASSRPGDVVMDCFAGSGNTGLAAESLGRDSILIEKDPVRCGMIAGKISGGIEKESGRSISSPGPVQMSLF